MITYMSKGIVFRLNAILLPLIALGLLVFALIVGVDNYKQVTGDLKEKSEHTLELATLALRDSVWNIREIGVRNIAQAVMSDSDVIAVKIIDADNFEMANLKRPFYRKESFEKLKKDSDLIYTEADVMREGDPIGRVHIVLSTAKAESLIRSNLVSLGSFAVLLILVIGGSVSLIANRIIKIPINILKEEAKALALGNLDQEIDTSRRDELGSLAKSFVSMRDAIREKIKLIEEYNRTLEVKVEDRTASLSQKTNDIQAMMENIHQGVFTLLPGNIIHHEYSKFLEKIIPFGNIAGANVMECLFANTNLGPDTQSQLNVGLTSIIGDDLMMFDFNKHVLVNECQLSTADDKSLTLELEWIPIVDKSNIVEKIMVTIRDVTEVRVLQSEANDQKVELEIIGEILSTTQGKFNDFVKSSVDFIDTNKKLIDANPDQNEEVVEELFRNMHTIKGNARTLGLLRLTHSVHETEQEYVNMKSDKKGNWDRANLLNHLENSRHLIDEYIRINTKKLGRRGAGRRASAEKYLMISKTKVDAHLNEFDHLDPSSNNDLQIALKHIQSTLLMMGTSRIDEVLSGVIESLPSLAKELDKEPPIVTMNDHHFFVKNQYEGLLRNTFMHLFRNSLDHGIEQQDSRSMAGKSREGNIFLDLSEKDGMVLMRYRDDGAGLNLEKIRETAIEMGFMTRNEKMPPAHLANFIFGSGFSTSDRVTEVSGRGVGLDSVKKFLEKENGTIYLHFLTEMDADTVHCNFELRITLPLNYFVFIN